MSETCTDPIFILGIMPRSGTNFLNDLLCLHPDCGFPGAPLGEDYLLHNADLLIKYGRSVSKLWARPGRRGVDKGLENLLFQYIGTSLLAFLQSQIDQRKRLLTKTPSVRNLKYFFKLFPNARLLIVVRDGRAIVESAVNSFPWQYEEAIRNFAAAAHIVIEFEQAHKSSNLQYLLVKYEELCTNLEEELRKILLFLNLDVETYDFKAALNLPVKGSSVVRGVSNEVDWQPREKPKDFNPLLRCSHWDRAMHERFNWIAGNYMIELGYELKQYPNNQLQWSLRNRSLDWSWRAKGVKEKALGKLNLFRE